MELVQTFDFLPGSFNPYLRILVYALVLLHLLALGCWCFMACPSILSKSDTFSDRIEAQLRKNKDKTY